MKSFSKSKDGLYPKTPCEHVVKIFDVRDSEFIESEYQNELRILTEIGKSQYADSFSELVDFGTCSGMYSLGKFSKGEKFIVLKKLGHSI
jgi:serine/threonine protein kinase